MARTPSASKLIRYGLRTAATSDNLLVVLWDYDDLMTHLHLLITLEIFGGASSKFAHFPHYGENFGS
jgi:hypothetical protein